MVRDTVRRPARSRRAFLAAVGSVTLAGCSGSPVDLTGDTDEPPGNGSYDQPTPGGEPDWEGPTGSPRVELTAETVVENLEIPWDVAFTGDGTYITERTGSVLRFDSGTLSEVARPRDAIDAGSIPAGSDERSWFVDGGEGGTLGIAVHPAYPDEPFVYVYYTATTTLGTRNRVVRYDVTADDPATTEETLVSDIPASRYHNGGRIRFGPDDNLWITTGDAGSGGKAGDPSYLGGKVLRVTPDGDPAPGNPDLDGDSRVFTLGHRNPQGIDWLPDGVPLISEHGPGNRDEVSVLVPGGNYGWNEVRGGPDDEEWDSYADEEEFVPPLLNTGQSLGWAPSGATFYTGSELPAWHNRFLVGGLVSQALWVVTVSPPGTEPPPLDDNAYRFDADWMHPAYTATAHRLLHDELGRIRHVAQSPDGEVYAITSNRDGRASGRFPRETDDVLVRLTGSPDGNEQGIFGSGE